MIFLILKSIFQKTFDEINRKIQSKDKNEFDFEKARHEVFKFGISGLNPTEKKEANIAHAISLGAKPRKGKNKNYKQLMEERKQMKIKELEEKEQKSLTKHKTKIYKKTTKKSANAVKGFDYQVGKYRDGVQFVDKKQIKIKPKLKTNKRRK